MSRSIEEAASLNLFNYVVCSDDFASCGQPSLDQIRRLPGSGFESVINLLPVDSSHAIPGEADTVRAAGMEYIAIPVLFDWPSFEDVEEFCIAMDSLAGRRVLVHCAVNCRGTFFSACYLMLRRGMDPDRAMKIIERIWCPLGIWKELWEQAVSGRG